MYKKIFFILLMVMFDSVYAEISVTTDQRPIPWTSKNSTDEVTINNGNGNRLTITINVDKNLNITSPTGVNVKNCGNTSHIDAGSTAICTTIDASNPVSFSSDSPTNKVSGTYILKPNN
jgi:hypothetical protein